MHFYKYKEIRYNNIIFLFKHNLIKNKESYRSPHKRKVVVTEIKPPDGSIHK